MLSDEAAQGTWPGVESRTPTPRRMTHRQGTNLRQPAQPWPAASHAPASTPRRACERHCLSLAIGQCKAATLVGSLPQAVLSASLGREGTVMKGMLMLAGCRMVLLPASAAPVAWAGSIVCYYA
jgi:hypothetical protein